VLIGRPFVTTVYGAGAEGPAIYVNKLKNELKDAMEMCGCASLKDITKDVIFHG
jgi:isopentenyl diphosphate isomerase/L-lactate dehydrogenase-like FMN-dependent dehydrogenase